MKRPLLRPALLAIGIVLLALAAWLRLAGCAGWAFFETAVAGFLLIGAVVIERWRYQPLGDKRPGPDWAATGERFLDPETGRLVRVFYNPATGERRSVGR